jgi:hypothetical protein
LLSRRIRAAAVVVVVVLLLGVFRVGVHGVFEILFFLL